MGQRIKAAFSCAFSAILVVGLLVAPVPASAAEGAGDRVGNGAGVNLDDYTATAEMEAQDSSKTDTAQKNYQEADVSQSMYSQSLTQSAE